MCSQAAAAGGGESAWKQGLFRNQWAGEFYQMSNGVLVVANVMGLPNGILGFHIHTGFRCSGTPDDPFANTLTHYNPEDVPHPNHAGDMPPLFSNNGQAFQVFLTDRFSVKEIIRKTVVIHSKPDDLPHSQLAMQGRKSPAAKLWHIADVSFAQL